MPNNKHNIDFIIMTTTRKDALKAAAVVGLASLVSGEADIRDSADNFGKERSLQYQYDESWYDLPDQMQNQYQYQPVHYQQPQQPQQPMYNDGGALWWNGGEDMSESKAGKEHGNGGVASDWWQPADPYGWPQWESGGAKASKTHVKEEMWWQPSAPVIVTTPATEAWGWWAGSGKSGKSAKSAKAKSAKSHPSGEWWVTPSEQGWGGWGGSMQTTSTAATTTPAGKGDKDDEWSSTTSTKWAAPEWPVPEWPAPKSGKSAKSAKSGKSGKSAKAGETVWWSSTWSTPKPCGKAEDCEHNTPETTPETEVIVTPPAPSPVEPLVPITVAPVAGLETRDAESATSSPTTIIDALTSEAGWFKSEELAYKRERVEGLAKQMKWENSSTRPQMYLYVVVGAAAGLFFILC